MSEDADTPENDSGSRNCVVTPLYCSLPHRQSDSPVLHDLHPVRLLSGSRLRSIYAEEIIQAGPVLKPRGCGSPVWEMTMISVPWNCQTIGSTWQHFFIPA
jgi:hypothetical protein